MMKLRDLVPLFLDNQWTQGLLRVFLKYGIGYRTVIDRMPITGELENRNPLKMDESIDKGSRN